MKLLKLSAPRAVVLHNDDAFEASCQKPNPLPEDPAEVTEEMRADHARATERHAAWQRYLDSYDLSHLAPYLRAGAKPVIFKVRVMPPDAYAAMLDLRDKAKMLMHAVRYCVVDILNLETVDELGGKGVVKSQMIEAPYGSALDDVSMGIFIDPEVLAEVGAHCLAAGRLPKGLHKSG